MKANDRKNESPSPSPGGGAQGRAPERARVHCLDNLGNSRSMSTVPCKSLQSAMEGAGPNHMQSARSVLAQPVSLILSLFRLPLRLHCLRSLRTGCTHDVYMYALAALAYSSRAQGRERSAWSDTTCSFYPRVLCTSTAADQCLRQKGAVSHSFLHASF